MIRVVALLRSREIGDDGQRVAKRLERTQYRRELEASASSRWRPAIHDRAVRNIDAPKSLTWSRHRLHRRRQRRNHRIEQRQRQRSAHALQYSATRNGGFVNEHVDRSQISTAPLLTPNVCWSTPHFCAMASSRFAIGVFSGVTIWRLPLTRPAAPPTSTCGSGEPVWPLPSLIPLP